MKPNLNFSHPLEQPFSSPNDLKLVIRNTKSKVNYKNGRLKARDATYSSKHDTIEVECVGERATQGPQIRNKAAHIKREQRKLIPYR